MQSAKMPKLSRLVLCLLSSFLLAACQLGAGLTPNQPQAILGGTVQLAAPNGFCVDKTASRESGDSAVVLVGRCSTQVRSVAALISIAIGRSGSGGVMAQGPAPLVAYFQTKAGRAALSRDGKAREIEILQVSGVDGTLFLLIQDGAQGKYWRAITTLRGRLVTVSATGTPEIALETQAGRKLVDATLLAIRKANPAKPTKAVTSNKG